MVNISIAVTEVYSTEDEWGTEGSMGSVWETTVTGTVTIIGSTCLSWVFFFLLKMSYLTDFFLVGIFLFNFGLKRGNPSRLV